MMKMDVINWLPNVLDMGTIVPNMSTGGPQSPILSNLFGKTRRSILALLYGHPDESFYVRQIFRAAGTAPGASQRELKWLSEVGIIQKRVSGNQVYYQANPECPIFQELKSLITKTAGAGDVLRSALAPFADRINLALLYGSVASGKANKESDIDLIVVGSAAFGDVAEKLIPAQTTLRREINPIVFSPDEFQSKLKKGDHFLTSVLKSDFHFIVGDENELKRLVKERMAG